MEGCRHSVYGEEFHGKLFIACEFLKKVTLEVFILFIFTSQISVDNIRSGRLHTLITNAFSHIKQLDIISNMITLYFFGTAVR